MGYLHIDNLYKSQQILAFRTCYALEKIHGTSAHVSWREADLHFHSGGESYGRFVDVFDAASLRARLQERFTTDDKVFVYGEAYGGKQQGMSKTYGSSLKFVAFDVKVNEAWLAVPQAAELVSHLGLEFVDYSEVSTDVTVLDAERDKPSTQAVRNGISEPQIREGVVLRPPFEVILNNGQRVMAKHKRAEFAERGRPNVDLDPTKREMAEGADAIALEWVTPMRLGHVIDAMLSARASKDVDMKDIPLVISGMIEDVTREAAGEINDNQAARKAIGRRAAVLFKQRIQSTLNAGVGAAE